MRVRFLTREDVPPQPPNTTSTRRGRLTRTLRTHLGAIVVGALFLLLTSYYHLSIPLWESDNELSHYQYVQYILNNRALPTPDSQAPPPLFVDQCESGRVRLMDEAVHQFTQPPLYYLLGAAATFWVDTREPFPVSANPFRMWDPTQLGYNFLLHTPTETFPWHGAVLATHVLRLLSAVIGLTALVAVYLSGLLLFEGRRDLALAAMALTAFIPQVVFSSATVNNDILPGALGAWCAFFCLLAICRPARRWALVAAAITAGLAVIAKYSGIVLVPLVIGTGVVVLVQAARQGNGSLRQATAAVVGALAVIALPAIFWLGYSQPEVTQLLDRYPATDVLVDNTGPSLITTLTQSVEDSLTRWLSGARLGFATFWGYFGWETIKLPAAVVLLPLGMYLLAAVGVVRYTLDRHQPRILRTVVVLCVLFVLLAWAVEFLRSGGAMPYRVRGRYLLPAVSVLNCLVILGLHRLLPRRIEPVARWGLCAYLLAVTIAVPLLLLQPAYRPPAIETATALQEGEKPVHATFGGFAELLGYSVQPDRLAPGDPIHVTLVWRSVQPTTNNYTLSIHLLDAQQQPRAWVMSHPGHGNYPTSAWQPGAVFRDTYHLYWSETPWEGLPTAASLKVALFCPGSETVREDYLNVTDPEGNPAGDAALFGRVKVAPAQPPADEPPTAAPQHTFGNQIALENFSQIPEAPVRGQDMEFAMTWRALAQPASDYTVFVHLLDEQGNRVAGNDQPLTNLVYPSGLWSPGERVTHTHYLSLPADLPAGMYTIQMGLYDPQTGARLTTGTQPPGDAVELTTLTIAAPLYFMYIPEMLVKTEALAR